MAAEPTPGLHPSQNRALRECYAFTRQLAAHWTRLGDRLGPGEEASVLERGARAARDLLADLEELTAAYNLYGFPAAQGVGTQLAAVRNVVADRTLERNQALRLAVLDATHVTTLLAYLRTLGEAQGDQSMTDFCARWEQDFERHEAAARRVAAAAGRDPAASIEPLDRGPGGRVGHGVANTVGRFGEWFDRRVALRRRRQ